MKNITIDDLKKDGMLLRDFVYEQRTEDVCLAAVMQNKRALQYVLDSTTKVCVTAVIIDSQT